MTHSEAQEPELNDQEALRPGETGYRMYEDGTSPYSAKVRVYLHHKGIPYRRLRTSFVSYMDRIPKLVGFPILPVVLAPDGAVLQDSTPILEWLEARHPEPACLPEDPRTALLHWVIEDFADEYLPRFSMHYRWGNELSRETLSHRIARHMSHGVPGAQPQQLAPGVLARQSGFDAHLGFDARSRADLDAQLVELLTTLDAHFVHHAFLFGDRPSIADFALYGHLFAHLYADPFSMRLMEVHGPRTCNWLDVLTELGDARGAVGRSEFGAFLPFEDAVRALSKLLSLVASTWVPLGAATAHASVARDKSFVVSLRSVDSTFSTHHYRAWAFEQVQARFDALSADAKSDVEGALGSAGDFGPLTRGPRLHNGLYDGLTPPIVVDGIGDNRVKHRRAKGSGA